MMMRFHWGMAVGHAYAGGSHHKIGGGDNHAGGSPVAGISPEDVTGPRLEPMDVDPPDGAAAEGGLTDAVTNSDDSAYERPYGGSDGSFLEGAMSNNAEVPDVQEPESSDDGDEMYR
jgi:hypothetical protein